MSEAYRLPDKALVAASFSKAAGSYDGVAELQRQVADALLARLPTHTVKRWLDVGVGTGYCSRVLASRYPHAQGVALDLAMGMLQVARQQEAASAYVQGDAEALPLASDSVDLLISSLAVQWCGDFAAVLSEARRVLRPGGVLAFSSLCQGTLHELRSSWQAVDGGVHVNRFRRWDDYQNLVADCDMQLIGLQEQAHILCFNDLRSLTRSLKEVGAHNINQGRPEGLTGRARLRALQQAYESFRTEDGLPATYRVVYGLLRKV